MYLKAMKTLSSYFLTNHQYTRYLCQKNNISHIEEVDENSFGPKIIEMCNTYNIDFSPYFFTLMYESTENIDSFANFFITMLNKAEMSDYSVPNGSNSDPKYKVIEIMSTDIEYLLAGIACIQYFFL